MKGIRLEGGGRKGREKIGEGNRISCIFHYAEEEGKKKRNDVSGLKVRGRIRKKKKRKEGGKESSIALPLHLFNIRNTGGRGRGRKKRAKGWSKRKRIARPIRPDLGKKGEGGAYFCAGKKRRTKDRSSVVGSLRHAIGAQGRKKKEKRMTRDSHPSSHFLIARKEKGGRREIRIENRNGHVAL